MKDIYEIAREITLRRSEKFALATLVRAQGSSYRRPGARMLVCMDGHTVGSLSGGCLEEEVALTAQTVIRTGQSAMMCFDTRRRFGCDGQIDIFIEANPEKFLGDLTRYLAKRMACVTATRFEGAHLGSRVLSAAEYHASEDEFVQQIDPPIQLLIIGEGLDSLPLGAVAELLGWKIVETVDLASCTAPLDDRTAVVVKSHNYGRDFKALHELLPLNLHYVGLVGPHQRRDRLLNELFEIGVNLNAGFFAPAGLDLGAETPEEIALAIVSEIQLVFRAASGRSLRDRRMSIHAREPTAV